MTDLGTLGGTYTRVSASTILGGGGGAYTAGNSAFHAFLYSGGVMKDINPAVGQTPMLGN